MEVSLSGATGICAALRPPSLPLHPAECLTCVPHSILLLPWGATALQDMPTPSEWSRVIALVPGRNKKRA
jgi:hypothetical protein